MKKLFLLLPVLAVIIVTATSYKLVAKSNRIYPELETFFKSVDTKNFSKDRMSSLESIKYAINTSDVDYQDWNMIFYCSENTFRSQASQVFVQTLCYAERHKKIKIFSAGLTSAEISLRLIDYLTKIGYKVTKSEKDGKTAYKVKFSDLAEPIILFSKTANDKSLPTKDITSVIVCDVQTESDCKELKTVSTAFNLPFPKVLLSDTDEKLDVTLKSIAAEMVYVTKK